MAYLRGNPVNRRKAKFTLDKRLRYLERAVKYNRPELQHHTETKTPTITTASVDVTHLTGITHGDTVFERTGNQIKIHKIEIWGKTGNIHTDCYLLLGTSFNETPAYGDFEAAIGGMVKTAVSREFKTLWHEIARESTSNFRIVRNFKKPIVVDYNGSTANDAARNCIWFVIKNDVGASVNASFCARVYYTDN